MPGRRRPPASGRPAGKGAGIGREVRASLCPGPAHGRRKKAVRTMDMRIKLEKLAGGKRNLLPRQNGRAVFERKIGMAGKESLHDLLPFLRQETAGGVHP